MISGYGPIEIRWLECAGCYEYVEYCPFCGATGQDLLLMTDDDFFRTRDKINGEIEEDVDTELYKWWKTLEFDENDEPIKEGEMLATAKCIICGKPAIFTVPTCKDLVFICMDCVKKQGMVSFDFREEPS